MNTTYKIIYCDDRQNALTKMESQINKLKKSLLLPDDVEFKSSGFDNVLSLLKSYKYDLLILDWVNNDNNNINGVDIFNEYSQHVNFNLTNIIIFTGAGEGNSATKNIDSITKKYSNVQCIEKALNGSLENIIIKIEEFILETIESDKVFNYDADNYLLTILINDIGLEIFKNLLQKLKGDPKETYTVYPLSQGHSLAHVFKLKLGSKYSVVKIAKTSENFSNEIEKAKTLYGEFPAGIVLLYNDNNLKTVKVSDYTGFQVTYSDGDTLFKKTCSNNIDLKNILESFFLNNGFNKIYEDTVFQDQDQKKVKYKHIFEHYSDNKYRILKLKSSYDELTPIILKHQLLEQGKFDHLKNFLESGNYGCIDSSSLTGDNYNKSKVLCHGDLHSKNIIIAEGNRPFLIDTGRLRYDYWCTDICRLVVDLFIYGLHYGTYEYFDFNEISKDLTIAEKIIDQKVEDIDKKNNFLFTLKWLTDNLKNIHSNFFTSWEYKLGLLIEFVKVASRIETTPPNKRVIALVSAYKCMISANEELKKELDKNN